MNNLYLDGCSFTHGYGLIGQAGFNVTNNTRPAKSNLAISLDTYKNIDKHEIFVLGFTFSDRYYLKFDDIHLDLLPTRPYLQKIAGNQGAATELAYSNLHNAFYTLFDHSHWDIMSDMLVDNLIDSLILHNKKFFIFSFETRTLRNKICYPILSQDLRLPDNHLNKQGTLLLFDVINNGLGDLL